jgi:hypothetical protein
MFTQARCSTRCAKVIADQFSAAEAARTARKGLLYGLAFGAVQDLLSIAQGRPVGYVEFIRKHLGSFEKAEEHQSGP